MDNAGREMIPEKIKRMLCILSVLIIAVGVLQLTAYADGGTQLDLYVDGTKTTDGDGTQASPYNKIESAMAAAAAATEDECVIWIMGTLTVSGTVTWDFLDTQYDNVILKRHENYTGLLVDVTSAGSLTLKGVVMDGNKENITAEEPMIQVTGTLYYQEDTWLRNNENGSSDGGGISIESGASFEMSGGSISGNSTVGSGGGIYTEASIQMTGGSIQKNETTGSNPSNGGGIYVDRDLELYIEGGEISENKATVNGGGIYAEAGSIITCTEDSQINDNNAANGGGMYLMGASLSVEGSEICGNEASYGGGIQFMNEAVVEVVDNSRINGNTARSNGGAAYSYSTSSACKITIKDSELNENQANNGGALHTNRPATITDSEVNGNTATTNGGAIYATGTLTITAGSIEQNRASNGGAIYTAMSSYSNIRPDGVTFSGNTADTGYYWTVDESVTTSSGGYSYYHNRYVTDCSYSMGPVTNLNFTNAYNNYDIYYSDSGAEAELSKEVTAITDASGQPQNGLTEASPGDLITYTITYKNATAGKLLDVVIADKLPEHVELTNINSGSDDYILYAQDGNVTGSFADARSIEWKFSNMAYNTSSSIEVTVKMLSSAVDGTAITNTADMSYQLIEGYPGQTDSADASLKVVNNTAEISLYYYKETEQGSSDIWQLFDPQPDVVQDYVDIGNWFELPDTVLEEVYYPYYYTLSVDGHTEQFYFSDNTRFQVEKDTDVYIYCIDTTINIKIPADNFLWYANADTKNDDGTYEIRSAEYELINESPSRFMDLNVTLDSFSEADSGSTQLHDYEDYILLNFVVTDETGNSITDTDDLVGKNMFNSSTAYQGTYKDVLGSGTSWNYRFTGEYDARNSLPSLPAEGLLSDYMLKLTFAK